MANFVIRQRPPIVASLCLLGVVALLGPQPRVAMGPATPCPARGEWHGDLYTPTGPWQTLVVDPGEPRGRFPMPNLGEKNSEAALDVVDVDVVVSGFLHLVTPRKT
ncbi:hypothetical protein BH11MYX1_BH11MYX1_07480 [soil metagenome]